MSECHITPCIASVVPRGVCVMLPHQQHPSGSSARLVAMNWLLDDKYFTAIMTIVTIWALFGDDIRLLATEKPADEAFVVLTIICILVHANS